ncbi:MAG: hypothetical protein MI723_16950, partial [Caulobacterales bacterium]|nr:hypothetical protein [Caulobacterales bacterium]
MSQGDGIGAIGKSALQRLRRTIESDLSRAPWYRELALRGPAPDALAASLHELRPGAPARA